MIAAPQCPDLNDVPTGSGGQGGQGGQGGGDSDEGSARKTAQPLAFAFVAGLVTLMVL